jgi:hypothetical protein
MSKKGKAKAKPHKYVLPKPSEMDLFSRFNNSFGVISTNLPASNNLTKLIQEKKVPSATDVVTGAENNEQLVFVFKNHFKRAVIDGLQTVNSNYGDLFSEAYRISGKSKIEYSSADSPVNLQSLVNTFNGGGDSPLAETLPAHDFLHFVVNDVYFHEKVEEAVLGMVLARLAYAIDQLGLHGCLAHYAELYNYRSHFHQPFVQKYGKGRLLDDVVMQERYLDALMTMIVNLMELKGKMLIGAKNNVPLWVEIPDKWLTQPGEWRVRENWIGLVILLLP